MQPPTIKAVRAHLARHKPTVPDATIAERATAVLRAWGFTSKNDRVSRSHVCMLRNAKAKKWTGLKARAAWQAMADMKLIPGVPIEVIARAESTPKRQAGTAHYWRKKALALEAQLRGGGDHHEEPPKEVPVLTASMLRYFGFERNPVFDEIRGVKDVWWGTQHKEAREVLVDAAEEGRFVRLAGRRGAGKSLVGHSVLDELKKREDVIVVDPGAVLSGVITEMHLVTAVIQSIKRRIDGRDEVFPISQDLVKRWYAMRYHLVQQKKANRKVVIWLDEAHELKAQTFLTLKRFLDEVEGIGRRLLSVILIGQNPEAAYDPRARDLSEVTLRLQTYRIESMHDEMPDYLRYKIQRAGANIANVITPTALEAIGERAPFPLDANVILAQLLIEAFREKRRPIRREDIDAIPEDQESIAEAAG